MVVPLVRRREPQAGRRAEAKYLDLLSAWQHRALPRMRWVLWPLMALGMIGAFLPGTWKWVAGLFCGAGLALWLAWKDDAPWRIVKWHVGAEGERRTEKCLERLRRQGWYVAHDLPNGDGNIDHVAIGPGGVFLLDTKVWGGVVTIDDDGVPTVTPPDTPDEAWSKPELAGYMRRVAMEYSNDLRKRTHIRRWVQPVVVFWSPFDEGVKEAGGVIFVHGDKVVDWLQSLEKSMSAEEQRRLAQHLLQKDHVERSLEARLT
jgi:hypothetical protein